MSAPASPEPEVWTTQQANGSSHHILLCNGKVRAQGSIQTLQLNEGYWKVKR